MWFGNVGTDASTSLPLDMEVRAVSHYRPFNNERNGVHGGFGQINVDTPKSPTEQQNTVQFMFSFFDSESGEPVTLNRFQMTFVDFDQRKNGEAKSCITLRDHAAYVSPDDSEIMVTPDPIDSSYSSFCSTQYGDEADNPTNPLALTTNQKAKAVEFTFEQTSQIRIRMTVGCCGGSGRNFLFAGASDVVPVCTSPLISPSMSPPMSSLPMIPPRMPLPQPVLTPRVPLPQMPAPVIPLSSTPPPPLLQSGVLQPAMGSEKLPSTSVSLSGFGMLASAVLVALSCGATFRIRRRQRGTLTRVSGTFSKMLGETELDSMQVDVCNAAADDGKFSKNASATEPDQVREHAG